MAAGIKIAVRYRKVSTVIWSDEKFMDLQVDSKLFFLFLLTHPGMTSLGGMRGNISGLSSELKWSRQRGTSAMKPLVGSGMVGYSEGSQSVTLPNFVKHNPPENPKVIKSWARLIGLIPPGPIKNQLFENIRKLSREWEDSFRYAFSQLPDELSKGYPLETPENTDTLSISHIPEPRAQNPEPLLPFLEDLPNIEISSLSTTAEPPWEPDDDTGYLEAVRGLLKSLPLRRPPALDPKDVLNLRSQGVPFHAIEGAVWVALAQSGRVVPYKNPNGADRGPINSFRYFLGQIDHVWKVPLPPRYLDFLMARMLGSTEKPQNGDEKQ